MSGPLDWEQITVVGKTNKETIEYLYNDLGYKMDMLAFRLGVSKEALSRRMKILGIPTRPNHKPIDMVTVNLVRKAIEKEVIDRGLDIEKVTRKDFSFCKLARLCDTSDNSVFNYWKRGLLQIPFRREDMYEKKGGKMKT